MNIDSENRSSELPNNVLEAVHSGRKIDAIKLLREQHNLGLKEAKHIIDKYSRDNPNLINSGHKTRADSGIGRLLFIAIITLVGYFLLKIFE